MFFENVLCSGRCPTHNHEQVANQTRVRVEDLLKMFHLFPRWALPPYATIFTFLFVY